MQSPTLTDLYAARERVYPVVRRTPLLAHALLRAESGLNIRVKHENHNPTCAFKVRGGLNLIGSLAEDERRGVITATTGNHGQSIALACRINHVPCTIVTPVGNNPEKNAAMRALGAELIEHGRDFDEAREEVERLQHERGLRYVHSANEPLLIAGVGTYAVEIFEDEPDVDVIFVPIGAGHEVLGYLTLFRIGSQARWSAQEREAVLEIGREIGLAVRRARLYQRERLLVQQLTDLDHYKGEMIRSVTHELKNMMTAIRGHTELLDEVLEEGSLPSRSVQVIARNVDRLDRLCADMLMLARVNEGRRPFVPVPVDLRAVVEDAMSGQSVEALRPGLQVHGPAGQGVLLVRGMPEELLMAVGNVYANAVKYTPDGGSIAVALDRRGSDVVLSVTDTGIGIAEGDLATLFDEFDRSSNPDAKRRPGSGLGLAIVRRVMARHHGKVEVDSELGRGSTFRLVVPEWE